MGQSWLGMAALLVATGCGGRSKELVVDDAKGGAGAGGTLEPGGAAAGSSSNECPSGGTLTLERNPGSARPNVILLLDSSAATTASASHDGSIWDNTARAVQSALANLPDGLPLGAVTFPDLTVPGGVQCSTANRAPITPLDAAFRSQLASVLEDAAQPGPRDLEQSYALAASWLEEAAASSHAAIIVVTTGLPTHDASCSPFPLAPTREELAPLFDSVAAARDNGIDTFVIGSSGSDDARDVLSELAVAGGTPSEPCLDEGADAYCHFDASQGDYFGGTLTSSLETAVRQELMRAGCKLALPPAARALPGLVGVSLASDGGVRLLGGDSAGSSCPGGWYYTPLDETDRDGAGAITLCGQACLDYLADPSARVTVDCPEGRAPIPPK